ncbi:hypothetical protein FA95DRAFT_504855 [Auriscalpium vulgare]|uniref:Uncharacterized protein n=1 Tax=Auriscalpium vulgare TaxID=40419 RepID=A0ACB8RH93_9AGAM|nr:hypothetical protein FA95DRAFT_504855 [Auriscalpium vulgare]
MARPAGVTTDEIHSVTRGTVGRRQFEQPTQIWSARHVAGRASACAYATSSRAPRAHRLVAQSGRRVRRWLRRCRDGTSSGRRGSATAGENHARDRLAPSIQSVNWAGASRARRGLAHSSVRRQPVRSTRRGTRCTARRHAAPCNGQTRACRSLRGRAVQRAGRSAGITLRTRRSDTVNSTAPRCWSYNVTSIYMYVRPTEPVRPATRADAIFRNS